MHKFKQPYTREQQRNFDRRRKGLAADAEVYEYWVSYGEHAGELGAGTCHPTPQHAIDSMRALGIEHFHINTTIKLYPAGDTER